MSTALAEGAVFAQRYRVVRSIATGGMGAVYEVIHLGTHRHRALKVMHSHLFRSGLLRERFKREARVAADIQSEYVVDVFDTGVDEATDMPFLVMELLQGEDLRRRIERLGRLSPQEVVTYLVQVAAALDKSHAAGIVHRDLKPENIFLTQREDGLPLVKVLDFGVAKMLTENTAKLAETEGIGTPLFMPPEQLSANVTITSATDIHALGMVAYMLLVGTTYWSREVQKGNPYHFIMVAARGARESAIIRAAEQGVVLPAAFDAWFAKMTAFSPGDRFQRAGEAIAALEKTLGVEYEGPRPKNIAPLPIAPGPAAVSAATNYADARYLTNAAALTASVTMSGLSKSNRSSTIGGIIAVVLCAAGGALAGWLVLRPATDSKIAVTAAPPLLPSAMPLSSSLVASDQPLPSAEPMAPALSARSSTPLATNAPRPMSKTKPTTTQKKPTLDDLLGQQ